MKLRTGGHYMLLFFLTVACAHEQKSTQKYFDFDGLIDDQVNQLRQRGRVLEKVAAMAADQTDSTFLPSEKGWKSELEIFRDLELMNKPAYRDVYRIEDPIEDAKSNLKIRQYVASAVPLHLIKFYYQNEFSRLKKIEATITEKNLLYTTSRALVMEFEEEDGKPQLIRYSMNGFQKMVFTDTVRFSVHGQVDW